MARVESKKRLEVERLEERMAPAVIAEVFGTTLQVAGDAGPNRIIVGLDEANGQLFVTDYGREVGRFSSPAITSILVVPQEGDDTVRIQSNVLQSVTIVDSGGNDLLQGGGGSTVINALGGRDKLIGGPTVDSLNGGEGRDLLFGRDGADTLDGGPGADQLVQVQPEDIVVFDPADIASLAPNPAADLMALTRQMGVNDCTIAADQVAQLLDYASAATASNDAIIAIVDRNGRILGVRVEAGVNPAITADAASLTFAIDGAIAKARTGAFFGNNQAPLTSRVIEFISQTTMTEREINSNPNIPDLNSPFRGPGFVAPVGIAGHFPPEIANTPQVDLFAIEHTNRDSRIHPGPNRIREGGAGDDIMLSNRFNIDPAFVPAGQTLFPPESYGFQSGRFRAAQSRGIGTLPGGIPLFLNNCLVGGIGVFFPGQTGFATEENSALSTTFDPTKPDRSLEAEYIAFVTAGGAPGLELVPGRVGGVDPVPGFAIPLTEENQRIDLVGITLDIIGPSGIEGPERLFRFGQAIGPGSVNGTNEIVTPPGGLMDADGMLVLPSAQNTIDGKRAPEGWLVMPHDGVGITAAEVNNIIVNAFAQAAITRAAIRLPLDSNTRMVISVADRQGNIVGLFRMPDSTIFSIDVAVAKSRNVAYYADPAQLQPIDNPGVLPGTAFTNRTIRYLALPRFPEGIDGMPPGPFSILNDGGVDPLTGRQVGAPLPASAFVSVQGFDAFNPGTNFRQPAFIQNQNGIVFFPGSAPLYRNDPGLITGTLIGGFGISGDGVDQDDVVTFFGSRFNGVPNGFLRADEVFVRDIRLPYQKFNRQPLSN